MRFARLFFVLVVLFCAIESVRLWYLAPESMAAHFNAQGNPDRFVSKLEFFSFQAQTALVVLVSGLVLQFLPIILPTKWINMPNREEWLANPERRRVVTERLSSFGSIFFALVFLVVHAGFELAVLANLQEPVAFAAQIMILVIIGFFIFSLGLLFWLGRSFRRKS